VAAGSSAPFDVAAFNPMPLVDALQLRQWEKAVRWKALRTPSLDAMEDSPWQGLMLAARRPSAHDPPVSMTYHKVAPAS
jgi:hypothetical protein